VRGANLFATGGSDQHVRGLDRGVFLVVLLIAVLHRRASFGQVWVLFVALVIHHAVLLAAQLAKHIDTCARCAASSDSEPRWYAGVWRRARTPDALVLLIVALQAILGHDVAVTGCGDEERRAERTRGARSEGDSGRQLNNCPQI
jgi:hypothetical protein